MSTSKQRHEGSNRSIALKKYWANLSPRKRAKRLKLFAQNRRLYVMTEDHKQRLKTAFSGPQNLRWKGGRKIDKNGYVMLLMPDHPNAYAWKDGKTGRVFKRYVLEHRYVMSQILGRPLDRYDIIHHINGNRADNRPENLEHLRGDNIGSRKPIICPHCGHAF